MKKSSKIIIMISFILVMFLGYYLGTKALKPHIYINKVQNFNAKVKEVNSGFIKIKGLDSNEKDFRNKWFVIPTNNVKLRWKNEKIKLINFNKGDKVNITFTGEATETYPITINNVSKIELLEETKNRRLVMLNNILYYDTKKISKEEKHENITEVYLKVIDQNAIPYSDNTSNFANFLKYKNKEKNIEILIDNKWIIFEPKELTSF